MSALASNAALDTINVSVTGAAKQSGPVHGESTGARGASGRAGASANQLGLHRLRRLKPPSTLSTWPVE